ncbi:UvrB/UvrC motif-containing protein [Saccharibacillus sp. CPCC 101409]|uniref:UvrB/UvrC motif-containing protein n=1 Tax=Saccharibacillus sp. CPCC 101409 TaxID=3058041 RepID=UPI0026713696|nr:UvrB/UvrC motif-containing protein [Saccharibacillus sp. CPCC 101409]MDO3412997.1 UvrB/UvrC motif-containing protein [Saccharibacillus sp. CPCC 101409]
MLCQECQQRPATLHFTKIINGEKNEFHICEHCAREKGEMIPGTSGGFSIHNLLSGFLDFDMSGKAQSGEANVQQSLPLHCEECGMTYAQFRKIGRFGCSSCYKYFDGKIDPLLKRVHGGTVHTGKVPKRGGADLQVQREIDALKQELQERIEKQEFETAAQLRDKIRELELQRAQR